MGNGFTPSDVITKCATCIRPYFPFGESICLLLGLKCRLAVNLSRNLFLSLYLCTCQPNQDLIYLSNQKPSACSSPIQFNCQTVNSLLCCVRFAVGLKTSIIQSR